MFLSITCGGAVGTIPRAASRSLDDLPFVNNGRQLVLERVAQEFLMLYLSRYSEMWYELFASRCVELCRSLFFSQAAFMVDSHILSWSSLF